MSKNIDAMFDAVELEVGKALVTFKYRYVITKMYCPPKYVFGSATKKSMEKNARGLLTETQL